MLLSSVHLLRIVHGEPFADRFDALAQEISLSANSPGILPVITDFSISFRRPNSAAQSSDDSGPRKRNELIPFRDVFCVTEYPYCEDNGILLYSPRQLKLPMCWRFTLGGWWLLNNWLEAGNKEGTDWQQSIRVDLSSYANDFYSSVPHGHKNELFVFRDIAHSPEWAISTFAY